MRSAADYIEELQTNGRLTFTTQQAVEALGLSVPAVRAQLLLVYGRRRTPLPQIFR